MADPIPVSTPSVPDASVPSINGADFFFALGGELRWSIFRMLADGKTRTAVDVAAVLNREFDGVSKHLRTMRAAGVLSVAPTEDRRYVFFTIAPEFRKEPGVVDYGFCRIDLTRMA
ncbi:MAG: Helix-turn-helix domain [Verrucomicrobiota bacterium]